MKHCHEIEELNMKVSNGSIPKGSEKYQNDDQKRLTKKIKEIEC